MQDFAIFQFLLISLISFPHRRSNNWVRNWELDCGISMETRLTSFICNELCVILQITVEDRIIAIRICDFLVNCISNFNNPGFLDQSPVFLLKSCLELVSCADIYAKLMRSVLIGDYMDYYTWRSGIEEIVGFFSNSNGELGANHCVTRHLIHKFSNHCSFDTISKKKKLNDIIDYLLLQNTSHSKSWYFLDCLVNLGVRYGYENAQHSSKCFIFCSFIQLAKISPGKAPLEFPDINATVSRNFVEFLLENKLFLIDDIIGVELSDIASCNLNTYPTNFAHIHDESSEKHEKSLGFMQLCLCIYFIKYPESYQNLAKNIIKHHNMLISKAHNRSQFANHGPKSCTFVLLETFLELIPYTQLFIPPFALYYWKKVSKLVFDNLERMLVHQIMYTISQSDGSVIKYQELYDIISKFNHLELNDVNAKFLFTFNQVIRMIKKKWVESVSKELFERTGRCVSFTDKNCQLESICVGDFITLVLNPILMKLKSIVNAHELYDMFWPLATKLIRHYCHITNGMIKDIMRETKTSDYIKCKSLIKIKRREYSILYSWILDVRKEVETRTASQIPSTIEIR